MMTAYTPAEREFAAADKAEKTAAIKSARDRLIHMEALIEASINHDPPQFAPPMAADLRAQFAHFASDLDRVIDLLAHERDEFADLNARMSWLSGQVKHLEAARDEANERVTKHYNEKIAAERELHAMRLRESADADCE